MAPCTQTARRGWAAPCCLRHHHDHRHPHQLHQLQVRWQHRRPTCGTRKQRGAQKDGRAPGNGSTWHKKNVRGATNQGTRTRGACVYLFHALHTVLVPQAAFQRGVAVAFQPLQSPFLCLGHRSCVDGVWFRTCGTLEVSTHTHTHTATQPHTPAAVRLGSDTFILMGAGAGARRRCWTRRNIRGAMRDAAAAAAAATTRASAETPPRSTACVTERWAPTMADSCTTASMSFISSAGDCWKDCVSMLNLGSHARTIECARGPRQQPLHVA